MSQENKYRDSDKNVYDLPQPVIPQSDEYKYVSIGINSDGTFKKDVTITQTTPIWFISRLTYDSTALSYGFINLINNSGIDLLITIEVIERLDTGFYPPNLFDNTFFTNLYSYGDSPDKYSYSKYFFALKNNENVSNKASDWVNRFSRNYYPMGIIYSRPLFIS